MKNLRYGMTIIWMALPFLLSAQPDAKVSEKMSGFPFDNALQIASGEYVVALGKLAERNGLTLEKFNTGLQLVWNKELPDGVISMVKSDGKIAVFSTPDWRKSDYTNIKTLHVTVIDPQNGNTILDKDVLSMDGKFFVYPFILRDSADNFQGLLLRYSNMSHIQLLRQEKSEEEMLQTRKMDWIHMDDNMNVTSTLSLQDDFTGKKVVVVLADKRGDIFVSSTRGNRLDVDKYITGNASKTTSLSVVLPGYNDNFDGYNTVYSERENVLRTGISYRGSNKNLNTVTASFDFSSNKVASSSNNPKDVMDLGKSKGMFEHFEEVAIDHYNGKMVTIQQYKSLSIYISGKDQTTIYNSDDLLVTLFDEKMEATKHLAINMSFPTYIDAGKQPGYTIKGNKLYILTNIYDKKKFLINSSYKLRLVVINLDEFQMVKDTTMDNMDNFFSVVVASPTLWLQNAAIIFHVTSKGLSPKNYITRLEELDLPME